MEIWFFQSVNIGDFLVPATEMCRVTWSHLRDMLDEWMIRVGLAVPNVSGDAFLIGLRIVRFVRLSCLGIMAYGKDR